MWLLMQVVIAHALGEQMVQTASYQRTAPQAVPSIPTDMQDTWMMLVGGDTDGGLTAVAVGIAKLGEPAVLATHKEASSFVGTGRALSAAAGRLSYVHGLKVCDRLLVLGPDSKPRRSLDRTMKSRPWEPPLQQQGSSLG